MPKPKADESQADYVARFMSSAEAQKDYPDQKQRAAVAYSMWEHRNEIANAASSQWPKLYRGRNLEPGLVRYEDIGDVDPVTGQPKGMTLLLRHETIDRMRPSFPGKPVVNAEHKKVNPNWFKEGKADGAVMNGGGFGPHGWDEVMFMVWDDATKVNCENGFELSCAYVPTKIDHTPGIWHAIPYDGEILEASYTHLAVVPEPRYKGASIEALNSKPKGGAMSILKAMFKRNGTEHLIDLDPKTEVAVDGKQVALAEMVNAFKAEEAAKAKLKTLQNAGPLDDESMIDMDGAYIPLKNLKNAYRDAMVRKNAEDDEEKKKKAAEEKKNAEDDEKKKKADEEKKNAEDAEKKKKDDEEKKNADEKAKKEKEEDERKNSALLEAGRKHFKELEEAKNNGGVAVKIPVFASIEDKVRLGAEQYGSKKGASK